MELESQRFGRINSILSDVYNLKSSEIRSVGKAYNNFVHEVYLSEATASTQPIPTAMLGRPGLVPIPTGTTRLIFRIPNPEANMNEEIRVQNEVAAAHLMRAALAAHFDRLLVPEIYGWSDNSVEVSGWIVQEFMPGETLNQAFNQFTLEQQRAILSQIADIVNALQKFRLPNSVRGCGGLRFESNGDVVSGAMSTLKVGPFDSAAGLYKGILVSQLHESDKSTVLQGWRLSNLRNRLENFVIDGVEKVIAQASGEMTTLVLIHGDLCLQNLLFDRSTNQLTAVLDLELSHIAPPINEFFNSFPDLHGLLHNPDSDSSDKNSSLLYKSLISGFPTTLPQSAPPTLGPVRFGTPPHIQWEIAKAWDDSLEAVGALRPRTIAGAGEMAKLYWFLQDICQFYFLQPRWIESRSEEQLNSSREEAEKVLDRFLREWGY